MAVLRIATSLAFWATKTDPPSGEIAMPSGLDPAPPGREMGPPDTVFVSVKITETVPSPLLATQAVCPSGEIAMPLGIEPTASGTVATTELLAVRDHRHRIRPRVGHISKGPIRRDRHIDRPSPNRNRPGRSIRAQVQHRNRPTAIVGHISIPRPRRRHEHQASSNNSSKYGNCPFAQTGEHGHPFRSLRPSTRRHATRTRVAYREGGIPVGVERLVLFRRSQFAASRKRSSKKLSGTPTGIPPHHPRSVSTAIAAVSVGLTPTRTPLASSASFFACAVPLDPEMIAPACPICLPGGAVNPAM